MAGSMQLIDYKGRLLNHLELVYRPGEKHLVARLFTVIGCDILPGPDTFLLIPLEPGNRDTLNNALYASEVTPEQWRFEQQLQRVLSNDPGLAGAHAAYDHKFHTQPQRTTHFGIRYSSFASLEEVLSRFENGLDPELRGRVEVAAVFRPGEPGSQSDEVMQVFLKTDVAAAGLITLGQHIELQAQRLED